MMSSEIFEYKAPQFVDFNAGMDDSDEADTFFDVEYEEPPTRVENKENETEETTILNGKDVTSTIKKDEAVLPVIKEEIVSPKEDNSNSFVERQKKKGIRRMSADKKIVLSTGVPFSEIAESLGKTLDNLSMKAKRRTHFDGIPISIKEEKPHTMTTRSDTAGNTPQLELRSRVVKMEAENRKRKSSRASEVPMKYMAMAEHILHFQKDTPPRYHSSKRRFSGTQSDLFKARMSYKGKKTVPLTPKLMTAFRTRQSLAPSQLEKEEMEVEEMKKHKIKAMPLNERVLQPPKPLSKSVKPQTLQEPFNLTQVFKKPAPKPEAEPYVFCARPVPRVLLERPVGVAPKVELPVTVPQSPAITKSTRNYKPPVRMPAFNNDNNLVLEEVYGYGVPASKVLRPKNTEVKPFSFENRDKEMLKRKEKKKEEILAAEKKAREFKANPVPSFVPSKEVSARYSHLDCSKVSTTSSQCEEPRQPFRARSPRVLRKEPFRPVLDHSHSQPGEVTLHTERRLEERRQFEVQQMMKEERIAYEREQIALERRRREEEEVKRLRQEAVHKAQPMPKFKAPLKMPACTLLLTEPKSPNFSKRTRTTNIDS